MCIKTWGGFNDSPYSLCRWGSEINDSWIITATSPILNGFSLLSFSIPCGASHMHSHVKCAWASKFPEECLLVWEVVRSSDHRCGISIRFIFLHRVSTVLGTSRGDIDIWEKVVGNLIRSQPQGRLFLHHDIWMGSCGRPLIGNRASYVEKLR